MVKDIHDSDLLQKPVIPNEAEFLYNQARKGDKIREEVAHMLRVQFKIQAHFNDVGDLSLWYAIDTSKANYGMSLLPGDSQQGYVPHVDDPKGWESLSDLVQWCVEHRDSGGIKGTIRFVSKGDNE